MPATHAVVGGTGMDALSCVPSRFGRENFGSVDLGDRRRNERLVRLAEIVITHPNGTLPEKMGDPARLKALYRLVDRPMVTHDAVLQTHFELTRRRMADHQGVVLVI